jgi:hypothetical protein
MCPEQRDKHWAAQNLGAGLELLVVATDQVPSNQVRFTGQIGNQCPPENHPDRPLGNIAATTFCYGARSCPGAMPRTTYRNLRTCLSLSLGPKYADRLTLVHRSAYPGCVLYRPDPAAAAQRSEGTVRSDLGLKYRAYSLTVTKGSKFADDCQVGSGGGHHEPNRGQHAPH